MDVNYIYERTGKRNHVENNRRERETISLKRSIERASRMGEKHFIMEFKRGSLSGLTGTYIKDPYDFVKIIGPYANAISVLTEPEAFLGSYDDIRFMVGLGIPVLDKDFINDKRMIKSAYNSGADAILLISDFLERSELQELCEYANSLEMDTLVEFHDLKSAEKIPEIDNVIIGYNRRNLRTLKMEGREDDALKIIENRKEVKVLESGISVENFNEMMVKKFQSYLIGTSILVDRNFLNLVKKVRGNTHED
ncbi:indole-3-glycerol-phosphate synthase TrpC [Caldiplasma sukawensis]